MNIEIPYTPTAKQRVFHATDANEVLYGGAAGGGKMLELSTPILTLGGWKTMGTVEVGDMVFGLDGAPHKVLRCSPVKEHHAWMFIFDNGSKIVCDGEHLWFTYTAAELEAMTKRTPEYRAKRRATRVSKASGNKSAAFTAAVTKRNKERPTPCKEAVFGSVKTADEIVATLKTRTGRTNHAVPVTAPLSFPERGLRLDPYLLGLWLSRFEVSPLALQYASEQTTGFWAQVLVPFLSRDQATEKWDLRGGLQNVGEAIRNKWTIEPLSSNEITSSFYDYGEELTDIANTADDFEFLPHVSERADREAAYAAAEDLLAEYKRASKEIKELSEYISEIYSDESLSSGDRVLEAKAPTEERIELMEEFIAKYGEFQQEYGIKGPWYEFTEFVKNLIVQ